MLIITGQTNGFCTDNLGQMDKNKSRCSVSKISLSSQAQPCPDVAVGPLPMPPSITSRLRKSRASEIVTMQPLSFKSLKSPLIKTEFCKRSYAPTEYLTTYTIQCYTTLLAERHFLELQLRRCIDFLKIKPNKQEQKCNLQNQKIIIFKNIFK